MTELSIHTRPPAIVSDKPRLYVKELSEVIITKDTACRRDEETLHWAHHALSCVTTHSPLPISIPTSLSLQIVYVLQIHTCKRIIQLRLAQTMRFYTRGRVLSKSLVHRRQFSVCYDHWRRSEKISTIENYLASRCENLRIAERTYWKIDWILGSL